MKVVSLHLTRHISFSFIPMKLIYMKVLSKDVLGGKGQIVVSLCIEGLLHILDIPLSVIALGTEL